MLEVAAPKPIKKVPWVIPGSILPSGAVNPFTDILTGQGIDESSNLKPVEKVPPLPVKTSNNQADSILNATRLQGVQDDLERQKERAEEYKKMRDRGGRF